MKTEWRIFGVVGVLLPILAAVYAGWTHMSYGEMEVVGVVALLLAGVLCLMCGGFFWFVSRRIDLRPEDRADADIAEGAGEIGFFSPGSYWPIAIAGAATLTGFGLAYVQWWLVVGGLALAAVTAAGLLFEYYTGTRRTADL